MSSFNSVSSISVSGGGISLFPGARPSMIAQSAFILGVGALVCGSIYCIFKLLEESRKEQTSETNSIIGSGKLKTLELDLKGHTINSVKFSFFGNLSIRNGNSNLLRTTGEDNIIDKLISKVVNNTLILSVQNNVNLKPTQDVHYTLNIPNYIQNIDLTGSGSVSIDQVKAEQFSASITGSGSLNVLFLEVTKFFGKISGSGSIKVSSGKAEEQTVNISGSGAYKATDFIVDKVNIMISGSGNALVNAIKSLSLRIGGSGNCTYKGNPTSISKAITGSGSLRKI